VIPVDVYVSGCAARPEAIIDGVVKALDILEQKRRALKRMKGGREELCIERAVPGDAEEVLALQRIAYQSEAEIYNDFSLSPLRQTLEEIRMDFDSWIFLKAVLGGRIVGSVRFRLKEGTCLIRRLIVHPLYQNLGIGKKLLAAAEREFPQAEKYETFTGHKNRRGLYFYGRQGYRPVRREKASEGRERVYLEKGRRS